MSFKPSLEQLEDRFCPVVHSFSAGAPHSDAPQAGGTPANAIVRANLGGIPAPINASFDASPEGEPFDAGFVPGRLKP